MIILRHCFACQLHCNCIDSGLQLHVVILTEIMLTEQSQFLNFFAVTDKKGGSPVLFIHVFTSQNTRYSLCSATMSISPILER